MTYRMEEVDRRMVLGIVLVIAVLVAGCTEDVPELPSAPIDGEEDDDENKPTGTGVTVTGPTCEVDGTACAIAQLTKFSVPELKVSVKNTGKTPANIQVSGQARKGREMLTTMCDAFRIKEFRAGIDSRSAAGDVTAQQTVTLKPGERLDLQWFAETVPNAELSDALICLFRFKLTFTQDLQTMRQVQVRADSDVPVVSGLSQDTSATLPVELVVESDGTVVQRFIGAEQAPVQAQSYLKNRGGGTITDVGHPVTGERIALRLTDAVTQDCTSQEVRGGTSVGNTTARVCSFIPDRVSHSQIFDVIAETRYTYEHELRPVELRIGSLVANQ